MPRRPKRSSRLATAALWPVGIGLTAWHYMWRTTPFHRREVAGSMAEDAPPPMPPHAPLEEAQLDDVGVGPLFHRRYRARIRNSELSAEELMSRVKADVNRLAPTEFARFSKVYGEKGRTEVGDEYVVRMPGPWDGPVRVVDVAPGSFRLATLDGHLEAGQIEFRAVDGAGGEIDFTIESWARSGDELSRFMYTRLRMAKEVQFHMWTSFLERAAEVAGGRLTGGLDVETRRVDEDDPSHADGDDRLLGSPSSQRILAELHGKPLNFTAGPADGVTAGRDTDSGGWKSDEYCQSLPAERPGPPVPGGSWEVAQRLVSAYEFADPSIVRAVYYPDRPLEGRDMLLEVRFYGLRFRFGVRVGGVHDETRDVDGRKVRVWGWNYRTLQGHLEMGQMDYEVWKWLDTGEVEFRTSRFSRRAPIGNPIVRLGVAVFGRHHQIKFAHRACERMARLTAAALDEDGDAADVPRMADQARVRPSTVLGG